MSWTGLPTQNVHGTCSRSSATAVRIRSPIIHWYISVDISPAATLHLPPWLRDACWHRWLRGGRLHYLCVFSGIWHWHLFVWRPRFLINRNSRSTPADSGQITVNLSPHFEKLTNQLYWTLVTSRHTCGANTWSKTWPNPTSPLVFIAICRNFCRVFQNSPKHFKIYLHKSCSSCWGTQLSCRLAFQIWRGEAWKTCSKVSIYCSRTQADIQSWQLFLANSVEKNPIQPFWKWQTVARSATFVFKVGSSFIQIFGVIWI
jgi:hypothetical protein